MKLTESRALSFAGDITRVAFGAMVMGTLISVLGTGFIIHRIFGPRVVIGETIL